MSSISPGGSPADRSPRPGIPPQPAFRIYRPPDPSAKGAMKRLKLDGFTYVFRYWNAERWARLDEADRPAHAFVDSHGGHFVIDPLPDQGVN